MWIGAHAPISARGQVRHVGNQASILIEQLLWPVTREPRLELLQMLRIAPHAVERDLMRAPRVFYRQPVDFLRSGPAFRSTQHDHRPARPLAVALLARR